MSGLSTEAVTTAKLEIRQNLKTVKTNKSDARFGFFLFLNTAS